MPGAAASSEAAGTTPMRTPMSARTRASCDRLGAWGLLNKPPPPWAAASMRDVLKCRQQRFTCRVYRNVSLRLKRGPALASATAEDGRIASGCGKRGFGKSHHMATRPRWSLQLAFWQTPEALDPFLFCGCPSPCNKCPSFIRVPDFWRPGFLCRYHKYEGPN